ncbi:MAG: hypothetical protein Q9204_000787 [Flavoplaca sp. TL-2023a]
MHFWVLCLKVWWLALPLSTLQHPSKLQRRTLNDELEPRNGGLTSGSSNANAGEELDRREEPPPMPLALTTSNGWQPVPEVAPEVMKKIVLSYINNNSNGVLTNQTSNNIYSYRGRDPWPVAPFPPPTPGRGGSPYPPDPGPYPPDPGPYPPDPGPYPPDPGPYPPGPYPPDPYPPDDPNVFAFDWSYPPFGSKKLIVRSCPGSECSGGDMLTPDQRVKGEINFKTNDILFDVWILGYPLETAGGNLDTGVWVNVNLGVAKGYLKIYDIPGEPKDQIWMLADLHLPFRQHFYKNLHMFNIPHHGPPPNKQVSTA